MRWDQRLAALFEDLEQQAEGLHLLERDAEVAERTRAEYARVDFLARLHASLDLTLVLDVEGVGPVEGRLTRAGTDWCLLETDAGQGWVIRTAAVVRARGLSPRAVAEQARGAAARLGLRSVLRGLAEGRDPVLVRLCDGSQLRAVLGRVGADFAEVTPAYADPTAPRRQQGAEVVPFHRLAAVRRL